MAEWISECIEHKKEVGDALRDLTRKIHIYMDAAKPTCFRESDSTFLNAELELFRPGWKHFTGICILFGIAVGCWGRKKADRIESNL